MPGGAPGTAPSVLDGGQQAGGFAPRGHAQALAGLADAHVDAGRRDGQLLSDFLG